MFESLAAAITGFVVWRMVVRPDSSPIRGAVAGMLIGLVAHPVLWILVSVFALAHDPDTLEHVLLGVPMMVAFSTFSSLFTAGWITVPVGGGLGALVVAARRRFARSQECEGRPVPSSAGAASNQDVPETEPELGRQTERNLS